MKLLYSLALIAASAILSEGFQVEGDTTTLENVELYETLTNFPVVEDRALRGRNLDEDDDDKPPTDLFEINYYGSVPQIVKDTLANVTQELSSLINTRPDYELEEEVVVKDACQIPVSEDVVIKPQTMRLFPIFVGPFDADEVNLNTRTSGFPCQSYELSDYVNKEFPYNRTLLGRIQFNPALINDTVTNEQYVHDLLLHEAIHVLGVGVYWKDRVKVGPKQTLRYKGSANYGYEYLLKKCDYRKKYGRIPLDDDKRHWKGSAFPTEIMSSTIEEGKKQILNQMTAFAIADLGFYLNWKSPVIQPYKIPFFEDKEARFYNEYQGYTVKGKLINAWDSFKSFWDKRVLGKKSYIKIGDTLIPL